MDIDNPLPESAASGATSNNDGLKINEDKYSTNGSVMNNTGA